MYMVHLWFKCDPPTSSEFGNSNNVCRLCDVISIGKVTIHGLGLPGLPGLRGSRDPQIASWQEKWDGLQKAMKFIFQISALPILWISNVSYDVNVMKSLGLLSASFWEMDNYWIAAWMKSLESLNFMLGLRRTNGCQPIVKKNLGILHWTWGAFCKGEKASFMWF